jgi:hypothetical protein
VAGFGLLFWSALGAYAQPPTSLTNAWGSPWTPRTSADRQVDLNQALQVYQAEHSLLGLPGNSYTSYSSVTNIDNMTSIDGSNIDADITQQAPNSNQSGAAGATTNVGGGGFKTYAPIVQK